MQPTGWPGNQGHLNDVERFHFTSEEIIQSVTLWRKGYDHSVLGHKRDMIISDLFHQGTINASSYCDTFSKFGSAIRRKRSGLLNQGVMLLDDIGKTTHRKAHIR
ncbi:hypothetical protein NPIL_514151 [Nephila pilipes]|uniref:Uncharacterized protein n=1 Tax=Nephila pilipes TaxID=299642 RepID=A0A8X6MWQ9_NEPPI|nr:hypothetical protein NPIL_514151 [Nephila pilipes]